MRPVASPAAFKSEPRRRRPRTDGATISASPVKASRPAAMRVHSVVEVARLAFNKDPSNGTHFGTNPRRKSPLSTKCRDVARPQILARRERRPVAGGVRTAADAHALDVFPLPRNEWRLHRR